MVVSTVFLTVWIFVGVSPLVAAADKLSSSDQFSLVVQLSCCV